MGEKAEVYRLRHGRQADGALYTDRARFEWAVLEALVHAHANRANGYGATMRPSMGAQAAAVWRRVVLRKGDDYRASRRDSYIHLPVVAEELRDGEWVDLGAELVEPHVKWNSDNA